MKQIVKDIDGRDYYLNMIDPGLSFNRIQITLSHLLRNKMKYLNNKNYSDCLFNYLSNNNIIRKNIIEIGGGLGDVAYNLIKASQESDYKIDSYVMFDVSPTLLSVQQERYGMSLNDYICDDCHELSKYKPNFRGMILANAMIADLRSVFISKHDKLKDYGINDDDFDDFANEISRNKTAYYLHVGTLDFIRNISEALDYGGTAVITEYYATKLNQPSLFNTHYECGIDFSQIEKYAKRIGFETDIIDIETILGVTKDITFLTVDMFTSKDKIALRIPQSVKLWAGKGKLEVLAYTKDSLLETLTSEGMGFSNQGALELVDSLSGCFHSIHSPKFDHINPTTWGYKCLVLKKTDEKTKTDKTFELTMSLLSDIYSIPTEEAEKQYNDMVNKRKMGDLATEFVNWVVSGLCWDIAKAYGPVVGAFLFKKMFMKKLIEMQEQGKITSPVFVHIYDRYIKNKLDH